MDELIQIAIEYFGNDYQIRSTGKDVFFCCPFCWEKLGKQKTDYKLGVCVDPKSEHRLQWHCFRCGSSGRLRYTRSVKNSLRKLGFDSSFNDSEDNEKEGDSNMAYLPRNPIKKDSEAYNYLISRGIDDEKIEYYQLREGKDRYSKRIIIPNKLYGMNWTDMFQGRDYTGKKEPKYLNPTDIDKSKIVFNLHRQEKNCNQLIICEGAITSICGGKNCIGVYGSHPSITQLKQIIDYNPKELVCCLDNDPAGQTGMKQTLKDIQSLGFSGRLYFVTMPEGKDAADLGEKAFQEYVFNNKKIYNTVSYKLISKLL